MLILQHQLFRLTILNFVMKIEHIMNALKESNIITALALLASVLTHSRNSTRAPQ